jgi:ribonuclease HII
MPWIIGIDEAGYGPNLGPFVMTSVACHVSDEIAQHDLWHVLRRAVRRQPSVSDGRLFIEDSKIVYSTTRGLHDLETSVLAVLRFWQVDKEACLADCIDRLCPACHAELRCQPWYAGTISLPVCAGTAMLDAATALFENTCRKSGVVWGTVRSVVICPARFNQVTEQWGSKGAVLASGLAELVRANRTLEVEAEPARFFVDKHGGRNRYAAILQHALPEGLVVALQESMERSAYSVMGLSQDLRLTFEPRADRRYFCVALASMISKYLRELLMLEFNRFWQGHVPGLKPTAGYPGDAARFLEAIRPVLERLQIAEPTVWRQK